MATDLTQAHYADSDFAVVHFGHLRVQQDQAREFEIILHPRIMKIDKLKTFLAELALVLDSGFNRR